MELGQLRAFLAVMDTASVTRAAESLGITAGAVSQQIRALANGLGSELFVRSGRRIVPTTDAFRLAEHARAILHRVRETEDEFTKDPAGDTRPFHFATGATALIYRLGKPLRLLRRRFPHTEILVTVGSTEDIVAGLLSRRFDLGLISMPVSDEKLDILPLFEEELIGLRPAHQRTAGSRVVRLQAAELADVPFLLYPKRSNMRQIIDGFFHQLSITPRVVMEADDTEVIKRLVESGFGYSMLPEFSVRGQSRFLELFRVAGHRLVRRQALAMPRTEYPRPLTQTIAKAIYSALAGA
jgi:DNA-binding transcriptional LysR family regulator